MSRNFEELEAWKKSCQITIDLYDKLESCNDYDLKDQMTRAAVSKASNIAEGAERRTQKDFLRFLDIAKVSAAELRTQLYIASKLNTISGDQTKSLIAEIKTISRMIQGL